MQSEIPLIYEVFNSQYPRRAQEQGTQSILLFRNLSVLFTLAYLQKGRAFPNAWSLPEGFQGTNILQTYALFGSVSCCLSSSSNSREKRQRVSLDATSRQSHLSICWTGSLAQMLEIQQGGQEQGCDPQAHFLAPEALLKGF